MSCTFVGRLGLVGCLLLAVSRVDGSPIRYDFRGTLQQSYDGSTEFSGSLVYNTDLPTYPGIQPSPGWSYYSGVPADPSAPASSLTFRLGDTPSSTFGPVGSLEVVAAHTKASDGFFLQESFSGPAGQIFAEFGISNDNLVRRAPFATSGPPASLDLSDFSIGANLTLFGQAANGQGVHVVGTITSLVPVGQVPEPSTALVFAALGACLVGFRAVGRSGDGAPSST